MAIAASISSCVVNAEDKDGFMPFVHETNWQAYASLKVNDTSRKEWYQNKQYSDSMYSVIAKCNR